MVMQSFATSRSSPSKPVVSAVEIRQAEIESEDAKRQERGRIVLRVVLIVAVAVASYLASKYLLPKVLKMLFQSPLVAPLDNLPKGTPPLSNSGFVTDAILPAPYTTPVIQTATEYGAKVTAAKTASALAHFSVVETEGIAYSVARPVMSAPALAQASHAAAEASATAAGAAAAGSMILGIGLTLLPILFAL